MLQQIQLSISGSFSVRENKIPEVFQGAIWKKKKEKQNTEHKPFTIL